MRNKNVVKIFTLFFFVAATFGLSSCAPEPDKNIANCFDIPENTYVIIHSSSLTDTTVNLNPNPLSQIYYYNKSGEIIESHEFKEEIVNDFIMQGNKSVAFFLKNETYISTADSAVKQESKTAIDTINFGPSQIGYIEGKEIYYSLLNVGKKTGSDYINIVRFVSESKNYDVAIPYYLENISYDSSTDQFVCVISDIDSNDYTSFKYALLKYDDQTEQYSYDGSIGKILLDSSVPNSYMFRTSLVNNNIVYSAYLEDTEEFLLDKNPNKLRSKANLVLSVYDLEKQSESKKILKKYIALDELGYGILSGSNNLPMEVIDDKLYVFTAEKEAVIIENDLSISTVEMPYLFQGSLNLKSPNQNTYEDKENFFGSEVAIEDDGSIYILNLYPSKKFTIHKLRPNASYELVWEGDFPPNVHDKSFVNTFEILK